MFLYNFPATAAEKSIYPTNDCGVEGDSDGFLIVGFKEYPPFSWPEVNKEKFNRKEYHGFVPSFVKKALNNMQIVRIRDIFFDDFQQAQKAILHGKADMLFTSYYIDDTKSGQDYVYPAYFGNPFIVVSRATKKIDVNDASGLKGLKGIIRREEEMESLIRGILPKRSVRNLIVLWARCRPLFLQMASLKFATKRLSVVATCSLSRAHLLQPTISWNFY